MNTADRNSSFYTADARISKKLEDSLEIQMEFAQILLKRISTVSISGPSKLKRLGLSTSRQCWFTSRVAV
jgi:hypothetical protein